MAQTLQPVDAALVPRFAGIASFMRLPIVTTAAGLDVVFAGVPYDGGTTNRAGARHGPREIRTQSAMIRRINANGVPPYDRLKVADIGDCPVNPFDIQDALAKIEAFFTEIHHQGAIPIAAGGDHLISLPILRALGRARPLGLIHFDSHSDTGDAYFGPNRYTHGTPFRRAVEEGLIDPKRSVQIGIRGSIYDAGDFDFARAAGFTIISMEEAADLGPAGVVAAARVVVGEAPVYISFDIDSLDPAMAPGTGTPELGGFLTREAQRMLRGLGGLPIVGADVVEVSPPFDVGGITALAGATMMFELLSAIAAGRAA
jgi:guanidinopropionase